MAALDGHRAWLFLVDFWKEEEEEEEEEEADASYLLSSWPRSSSTPTVAWFFRHVVDVPVVRFVLYPQVLISSNDEICADNYIYFWFKLIDKGRSEQWEVFLYCDKTIKMTVIARKCCPGVCLRLAFVVSASVFHPTWQRITPSMSCACLLSVSWNELQSGRSTLEREVQWDFRVHGSSCGTCFDVLHSPLTVSTIDTTTTVVALYSASADCTGFAVSMCNAGACVAMSCDGGCFTPDGAYDSLCVAMPMKESTPSIPSCTKRTLGVSACSMTGTAATTFFAPTTTTSRFKLKDKCRSEKWEVFLYGDMTIKVMESRRAQNCGGLRSCSSCCDGMS